MRGERLSNFELCRIASIIMVLLVHTTIRSLGSDVSFGIYLLASFSIIGVNVFVLLTGYFSATPKKTSVVNLAFICFFWMLFKLIFCYLFGYQFDVKSLAFISSSNWFVPSYFVLLFIAPVLNHFTVSANKNQLWVCVICLLVLEVWFDWLPPQVNVGFNKGYSALHFILLYMVARAIKLYGFPSWFKKNSLIIYLGCSAFLAAFAYTNKNFLSLPVNMLAYNNPVVIISSISFLLLFEKFKIGHNKAVNHIAKSSLSILLGHYALFFLYTKQFKYLYTNFSGAERLEFWSIAISIVFLSCIAIDQIRMLFYHPIDNWLNKRIKNNNIL